MNAGAPIAAAALLVGLVVATGWIWRQGSEPPAPTRGEVQDARERVPATPSSAATTRPAAEAGHSVEREVAESALPNPSTPHAAGVESLVRGRVLLPGGEPAAGASVRIGGRATQAAADGAFELRCQDGEALVAMLAGYEPASIEDVAQQSAVRARQRLEVQLAGAAATIDGQLLTADGTPVKGWCLRLHGGTTDCGDDGHPPLVAEDFAAGVVLPGALPAPSTGGAIGQHRSPNETRLGDDGRFRISGLRRGHSYTLRAWNPSTLRTVISPAILAGTSGYRFVVPPGDWRERVYGRVIDRRGGAIADVRVRLTMRVHTSARGESYETGQEVRTGADGRFEFHRVVREDLLLRFDGRDVQSKYEELPAAAAGEDLLVVLGCECALRFEPAPGLPAPTAIRVLDQDDKALRIERQIDVGTTEAGSRLAIPAGSSPVVLRVGDSACWLVLECEGHGERRVRVWVQRGELTKVQG